MKLLFITIFFLYIRIPIFSQTVSIDKFIHTLKKKYEFIQNGRIDYILKKKLISKLDTSSYQINLKFCKHEKTTSVFLDIYGKEGDRKFHVIRSIDKKRAYYLKNDTIFGKQKSKIFIRSVQPIYKSLINFQNNDFFTNLSKSQKELTETHTHYILTTSTSEFHIDKESYLIEKLKYEIPTEMNTYYEYIEILSQEYNRPDLNNEALYRIEKPAKSSKTTKSKKPEVLLPNGADAPDWTLLNVQHKDSLSLADLKGKVVVLDFWYTSCPPCIEFLPNMKALHEEFADKGVTFVGMAYDKYAENIVKHLNKYAGGVLYANVLCSQKELKQYNVQGMPAFVVLDRNHKVVYAGTGIWFGNKSMQGILRGKIKKALKR